jgi:hypothetical protein
MLTAAILAQMILGGIWRRALGGWLGINRASVVAAGALLTWPLWLALPWWWAAPASALAVGFWTLGVRFDSWQVWPRYLVVGAIGYGVLMPRWPAKWCDGDFIDGGAAVGELWAGAVLWGLLALVLI